MARHDEQRAERLAAALRENLKRRKAQAREGVEGLRPEPVKKDRDGREEIGSHPGGSRDP